MEMVYVPATIALSHVRSIGTWNLVGSSALLVTYLSSIALGLYVHCGHVQTVCCARRSVGDLNSPSSTVLSVAHIASTRLQAQAYLHPPYHYPEACSPTNLYDGKKASRDIRTVVVVGAFFLPKELYSLPQSWLARPLLDSLNVIGRAVKIA